MVVLECPYLLSVGVLVRGGLLGVAELLLHLPHPGAQLSHHLLLSLDLSDGSPAAVLATPNGGSGPTTTMGRGRQGQGGAGGSELLSSLMKVTAMLGC